MDTRKRTNAHETGIHPSLPGRDYHDPAVWDVEKERIFYRHWYCVGRVEQIPEPGDYLLRDVGDESILIVRTKDGELRAFYNVCRHRGSRLCDEPAGQMKSVIKCPYHAWSYTFQGELVGCGIRSGRQKAGFREDGDAAFESAQTLDRLAAL